MDKSFIVTTNANTRKGKYCTVYCYIHGERQGNAEKVEGRWKLMETHNAIFCCQAIIKQKPINADEVFKAVVGGDQGRSG